MNRVPTSSSLAFRHSRGFTLVEVLISIAIALVLILGVSQIFSIAQRTTGAGTQVLADTEFNRGIQEMLLNDARGVTNTVGDSPGLVILSYPQAAFRNRVDSQQDNDGMPYTVNDPTVANGTINDPAYIIDDRIHRTDVLGFFARGLFTRRTGDSGSPSATWPPSLTSPTTSNEAFIWYGHLALPDPSLLQNWDYTNPGTPKSGTGTYWSPGSGSATANPNNFFASDWILGREVMLFVPATGSYYLSPHLRGLTDKTNPLWMMAQLPSIANDNGIPIYTSRYDAADASIAGYRTFLGGPTNTTWWEGLMGWNPSVPQQVRFEANPFIQKASTASGNQVPSLSAAIAQMAPIFVRGCTQFIVEFAGDYATQDSYGNIIAGVPDGQIDYYVDSSGARQIRWYGFPRDTTGTGAVPTYNNGSVLPVSTVLINSPNVKGITAGQGPMRFERNPGTGSSVTPAADNNKNWITNTTINVGFPPNNGLPAYYQSPYLCAWGPDTDAPYTDPTTGVTYPAVPRPKMIRITIGIDDPTGHLNTEQVYQYVLNLP